MGKTPRPVVVAEANNAKQRDTKKTIALRKKGEPTIKSSGLECPKHLPPDVKAEWNTIVGLYAELSAKIVYDLDKNALEVYCQAMVRYRKAIQKVYETSEVYVFRQEAKINPWLKVADEATVQIKRYGEMLLLDPISRARVGMAAAREEELAPIAKLLMGGRPK